MGAMLNLITELRNDKSVEETTNFKDLKTLKTCLEQYWVILLMAAV